MNTVKELRDELLRWSRYSCQPEDIRKAMENVANGLVDKVENFPNENFSINYDYTYNKDWKDEKAKITISPKTKRVQIHINNKFNKYKEKYKEIAKKGVEYWIKERKEILSVRGVIDFNKYDTVSFRTEGIGPNGRKTQFRMTVSINSDLIKIEDAAKK